MEKKRILIIDDELGFTRLVKLNLEKTGRYSVRAEDKSRRAMAAAREFDPDLILLDAILPGLDEDNFETSLRADAELRHIPIVFMTDVSAKKQADATAVTNAGGPLLTKPVSLPKLIECIERNLRLTAPRGTAELWLAPSSAGGSAPV